MATTVEQAFREFASNLEIKDRQVSLVSARRGNVVSALQSELSLHSNIPPKLIGSYDRHTLTRYLSEADIDVMVVLHYGDNKGWDSADGTIKALDRFRTILDSAYPYTSKRRDRNCIKMEFSEFKLDVVPAFRVTGFSSSYYKIPDSIRRQWLSTDPFSFADKITAVNTAMSGKFVPLIKMVKGWNREVGWPIRSFHLECLMYQHYRNYTQGYTYPSMLKVFFGNLPSYLSGSCYDPVMGDRVDSYLDNSAIRTKRQIAIEKASAAAEASAEAFEDQEKYHSSVAIGEWEALMGDFFPAHG